MLSFRPTFRTHYSPQEIKEWKEKCNVSKEQSKRIQRFFASSIKIQRSTRRCLWFKMIQTKLKRTPWVCSLRKNLAKLKMTCLIKYRLAWCLLDNILKISSYMCYNQCYLSKTWKKSPVWLGTQLDKFSMLNTHVLRVTWGWRSFVFISMLIHIILRH